VLPILMKLEEGFSNPMSFKSSDGTTTTSCNMEIDGESMSHTSSKDLTSTNRVIEDGVMYYRNNRKIKKFWSSEKLKDSWKDYVVNIQNGGISALFLAMCIFIDQTEIYIEKLNSKLEKHNQAEEVSQQDKNSKKLSKQAERYRKRKAGFYKEDSSPDESEEEEEQEDSRTKRNKRRKLNNESDFDEEEEVEEDAEGESEGEYDEEEEDEMEDDDSRWDSKCYVCKKPGEVICCETCTSVSHLKCLGLRIIPENDWHCTECMHKMQNKRQTRSNRSKKKAHKM